MCGIAGFLDPETGPETARSSIRAMTETLKHRGPDSDGFYESPPLSLGMRRLRIIDLSTGDQPICNEDGTVWTVCNGEIYNFAELREELLAKGHVFRTKSDTEVIVHQYEEDGERCVDKFRGMFAIALWDDRGKRLLLARDRFGVKPLFVAAQEGRFAFASEMKAFFPLRWVDRSWSPEGLGAFLRLGYIPCPWTAYGGIRKFEQGTTEVWGIGQNGRPELVSRRKFWEPVCGAVGPVPSFEEAAERLTELLKESVRLRLRSDVPLGAFLSGGLDSTAVVAVMRLCGAEDIKTFSIGFEEAAFNELAYAEMASVHLRTDHHTRIVTAGDAQEVIPLLASYDEPFADSSAIPTYFVSRLAREKVTVSLSGDGGDELFAGYSQYSDLARYRRQLVVPHAVRRPLSAVGSVLRPEGRRGSGFVRRLGLPAEKLFASLVTYPMNGRYQGALSRRLQEFISSGDGDKEQAWSQVLSGVRTVEQAQIADQRLYLSDDILVKVDRSSMAVSLESREPLLDHRLAEFANGLPTEYKLQGALRKRILKHAMKPYVPKEVIARKKMGFGVPMRTWLTGPLSRQVDERLVANGQGLFDQRGIQATLQDLRHDWSVATTIAWIFMSLSLWADQNQAGRPW